MQWYNWMFYYLEKDVKLQFKSKLVFTVKPVSSVVNRDEEGYYDDTDIMSQDRDFTRCHSQRSYLILMFDTYSDPNKYLDT